MFSHLFLLSVAKKEGLAFFLCSPKSNQGVVKNCLNDALQKSFLRTIEQCFEYQVARLEAKVWGFLMTL